MDSLDSMFLPPSTTPVLKAPSNLMKYAWIAVLCMMCVLFFVMRRKPEKIEYVKEEKEIKKEEQRDEPKRDDVRGAGIAVRDALLNYSVNAEQIASIVRYTVSILSGSSLPGPYPPPPPPASLPVPSLPPPPPRPASNTHFSVKGLELPLEEEPESEPGGEKQGKINADTNPLVLQMVKDRKT